MNNKIHWHTPVIVGMRMTQLIATGSLTLGIMWALASALTLTMAQFMILYGAMWVLIPEIVVRALERGDAKPKGKFHK